MSGEPETLSFPVVGGALAGERRAGEGQRVVLLHAGVADRRSWRGVIDLLAERGLDLVTYDRRGFGESPPGEDFSHLGDLLALLDSLGHEPTWLVGSSMGGGLAIDAALSVPERFAGLVLIAPAVSGKPEPAPEDLDPGTRRLGDAIDAAFEARDFARTNELEVRLWLDGPAASGDRVTGQARELALDMNRIALENESEEGAGASGLDAWSRLAEIDLPATIAWGDLDIPVAIRTCHLLIERLPDVRGTEVIAGTAHLPYLERPEAVAAIISAAIGEGCKSV